MRGGVRRKNEVKCEEEELRGRLRGGEEEE